MIDGGPPIFVGVGTCLLLRRPLSSLLSAPILHVIELQFVGLNFGSVSLVHGLHLARNLLPSHLGLDAGDGWSSRRLLPRAVVFDYLVRDIFPSVLLADLPGLLSPAQEEGGRLVSPRHNFRFDRAHTLAESVTRARKVGPSAGQRLALL